MTDSKSNDEQLWYNSNATNRALSFRIDIDTTSSSLLDLGNFYDVFNTYQDDSSQSSIGSLKHANNKNIARHIRVALASADIVQPYVTITGINNMTFTDDLVPLADISNKENCQNSKTAAVIPQHYDDKSGTSSTKILSVDWSVGGSLNVDNTELLYANALDVLDDIWDCTKQPDIGTEDFELSRTRFNSSYWKTLSTRLGDAADQQIIPVSNFKTSIDVSDFNVGDHLVLIAVSNVDKGWKESEEDSAVTFSPQSHLVNARTNPSWHHTNGGKTIDGRLQWHSTPVSIIIASDDSAADFAEGAIELSNRFAPVPPLNSLVGTAETAEKGPNPLLQPTAAFVFLLFLVATATLVLLVLFAVIKMRTIRSEIAKEKQIIEAEIGAAAAPGNEIIDFDKYYTDDTCADFYNDESCQVQVYDDSYVEDCDNAWQTNDWGIIDFTKA